MRTSLSNIIEMRARSKPLSPRGSLVVMVDQELRDLHVHPPSFKIFPVPARPEQLPPPAIIFDLQSLIHDKRLMMVMCRGARVRQLPLQLKTLWQINLDETIKWKSFYDLVPILKQECRELFRRAMRTRAWMHPWRPRTLRRRGSRTR